jgi:hypothetical protein
MTPAIQITRAQELRFYRTAVQASLEQFYEKTRPEAARLVRAWWKRLSESGTLKSDLFLHDEPMNTAAGIADVRVIAITSKNREAYHRILNQSRDLVLTHAKPKAKPKQLEPKTTTSEPQKQLVHVAT